MINIQHLSAKASCGNLPNRERIQQLEGTDLKVTDINVAEHRVPTSGLPVHEQFLERWSPRAMTGQSLQENELLTLMEAARWAPSCYNAQPWRFAYVANGSAGWQDLLATLVPGNQAWAARAAALIAVISRQAFEHNDASAPTHAFDAGAAWMSLALQAQAMGLVAHGMRGFELESARQCLRVPELYDLQAIIAVGHPGRVEDLAEAYQERELPSGRKTLEEIAFSRSFEMLTS
jgi:nitroreductase